MPNQKSGLDLHREAETSAVSVTAGVATDRTGRRSCTGRWSPQAEHGVATEAEVEVALLGVVLDQEGADAEADVSGPG